MHYGDDASARAHSELLDVVFSWNGQEFDALDPATGTTIDKLAAAEARAIVAEAELNLEQTARSQAETRAEAAEAELARLRAQLRRQEP